MYATKRYFRVRASYLWFHHNMSRWEYAMPLGRTLDYIERLDRARSEADVVRELLKATADYGFSHLLAGIVPMRPLSSEEFRRNILLKAWPDEWCRRYAARNYARHDPIIQRLQTQTTAFLWQDCQGGAANKVMMEASEFGLKVGLAVPFLTLEGQVAGISFAGNTLDLGDQGSSVLSTVACFAIGRAMRFRVNKGPGPGNQVSRRERECLAWVASGKSDWEISSILGISESTVEKHVQSARVKLAASNRAQAVAEAIRHGLIP